jgi:pyruvate formate lyase activating enzyme
MHEASLYEKRENGAAQCYLCAHRCRIQPEHRGLCAVRENRDGTLYSLVYGQVISQAVDPIEKKPLYHFLPGSTSYSIATPGCNFRCQWCQNWQISQAPQGAEAVEVPEVPPERIVAAARRFGCASISYTYTEPTIFFEYAYDVARLAREHGIANVFVTNGYMTPECLELLGQREGGGPLLAAANVDLKAWNDEFYRRYAGARLEPVLESLRLMKQAGIWVEVTTLLIPGLNDAEDELRGLAQFLSHDLGPETPWHVTRFHPDFRMGNIGPTPTATLRMARQIGLDAGLQHVYEGNIPGTDGENTYCPGCGCEVVSRYGFRVLENRAAEGVCPECRAPLPGVWVAPAGR